MIDVNIVGIVAAAVSSAGGLVAVVSTIGGWNFRLLRIKQEAELLSLLPIMSESRSALAERVDRLTGTYVTNANRRFNRQEIVAGIVMLVAAIFNTLIASTVSGLDWSWVFAAVFFVLAAVTFVHSRRGTA